MLVFYCSIYLLSLVDTVATAQKSTSTGTFDTIKRGCCIVKKTWYQKIEVLILTTYFKARTYNFCQTAGNRGYRWKRRDNNTLNFPCFLWNGNATCDLTDSRNGTTSRKLQICLLVRYNNSATQPFFQSYPVATRGITAKKIKNPAAQKAFSP